MPDKWSTIDSKYARPARGKNSLRPTQRYTVLGDEGWTNNPRVSDESEAKKKRKKKLVGVNAAERRVLSRRAAGKALTADERGLLSRMEQRKPRD